MKKIWQWLKDSNRIKHLLLGVAVGLGVAGSLEFKDYQWGGKPDWIDFTLTFVGVNIGYTIRYFVYE